MPTRMEFVEHSCTPGSKKTNRHLFLTAGERKSFGIWWSFQFKTSGPTRE